MTPTQPSFPDFFRSLWGYDSFPWQSMLAEITDADLLSFPVLGESPKG